MAPYALATASCASRIEFLQRFQHGENVLPRHPRTHAAAHRKNNPLAARGLQHFQRLVLHFVRRAAHRDLQRIDVAHQDHPVAHPPLHFADMLLLAPIEHVEARVGQVVETGIHFRVVVIQLDPVRRKRVADPLEIGVRELHVVLFVDEAHNVVQDENALHRVAHHLVLRLQPVDDHAGAQVDQPVRALRVFHQVDHEVRRAAHKTRRAQRTPRRHHRQNVAVVQNALPGHPDAVQRERRKRVRLHFVLRKIVDVFQPVQRVVFARRVVLPELDLRAQHRGLRRHPVLHPPRRDENDVGKLAHDLQIGFEPQFRIQEVVQVLDPQIAGNPRTVHDQSHRDLVHLLAACRALKHVPLFLQHDFPFVVRRQSSLNIVVP